MDFIFTKTDLTALLSPGKKHQPYLPGGFFTFPAAPRHALPACRPPDSLHPPPSHPEDSCGKTCGE